MLELVKKTGRPLLVFSTDMQKAPLSTLVYHKGKNIVQTCAVNIPWQAGEEIEVLKDIAVLTGATFIDNVTMKSVRNVSLTSLGSCNRVKIQESQTQLTGAKGGKNSIAQRIASIQTQIQNIKQTSLAKRKILQVLLSVSIIGTNKSDARTCRNHLYWRRNRCSAKRISRQNRGCAQCV